jgi:hypothetical protein
MIAAEPQTTALALARRLVDLARVVESIDDVTFLTTREDGVSGSIGAHVRHTIDHVAALVEPARAVVDYDSRRRGTDVERQRRLAAAELRRLADGLGRLRREAGARTIELSAVIDESGRRVAATSTVGRELVFVLSHTIHHQAIIALLLADRGEVTPARFGVAPSTPGHQPCAQSA